MEILQRIDEEVVLQKPNHDKISPQSNPTQLEVLYAQSIRQWYYRNRTGSGSENDGIHGRWDYEQGIKKIFRQLADLGGEWYNPNASSVSLTSLLWRACVSVCECVWWRENCVALVLVVVVASTFVRAGVRSDMLY
jgi:hypothetical protein